MSQQPLDSVRQRFDWDARNFDSIYRLERSLLSRWFNKTFRKAVFERYAITFEQVESIPGKRVLDIGCGSGIYAVEFARRGATQVVGIDFSQNMLDLAIREAVQCGVSDICKFVKEDFMLYNESNKCDITIAIGVFDYLPDPRTFLRKMAAVTSDKIIISFPGHSLIREPARRLRYWLSGRGYVHFYSEADVRQLASESGIYVSKIIPIRSSGSGFILVANCS